MADLSGLREGPTSPPVSSLLTFLIADVRGYTRFTNEQGDEAAARLASRFAQLAEDMVERHEGRVIELRGDEALAVFASARNALRASVTLQAAFREAMDRDPSLPLKVGIGLDVGEVIPVKGGYRGGALNLAARLCSIAGAGEVFCSETVIGLARKTEGIAFVDRGEVNLKGLSSPIRVIQIAPVGDLPEELPPLQPILVTHPNNLPDEPTTFIGRQREIDQIAGLLQDPHIRMVTLTGTGGTGKTRLALQVGNTLLHDFADGVFFCDLSSLTDASLVSSTIAGVLGVKEEGGRDLTETLTEQLKAKHLLLVLDNFEHLLDAGQVVADLLEGCRDLHVLVTSRIPLHLSWEQEHSVPPLSVPDAHRVRDAASLSQYESVALFIQRARAAKDGFTVTDDNAPAVAEICSRLDGLPLAIELAAARIKLFPPQALLRRMSNRLTLLTGGARDRPTRQQTLRGTIDWSYSLLTPAEQVLFARLSLFAGGWTFEAAETVCDRDGELDLLEGMASLVDGSLVRQEGEDEPRFSMLETIREYAGEKLEERGEGEEIRAAHARHFLALADEANRHLHGPEQVRWLDRLERDHDNLRAGLRWAIERVETDLALRLAQSLSFFWSWRGHYSEGRATGTAALALPTWLQLAARRTMLLGRMGMLALRQGDYPTARAYLDEGLVLARQVGDPSVLVSTLAALGFVARVQDDYAAARSALEEGLALARELGDTRHIAQIHHNLGLLSLEADQDLEAAWALNEQSLRLYRQIGNPRGVGLVLGNMGRVARGRGSLVEARALLLESVIALREIGDLGPMPQMLYTLAGVDADSGQLERAVRLQAAAMEMEVIVGSRVWPANRRESDGWLGLARAALGEARFAGAWAEGQAMTVERAVAYALEEGG